MSKTTLASKTVSSLLPTDIEVWQVTPSDSASPAAAGLIKRLCLQHNRAGQQARKRFYASYRASFAKCELMHDPSQNTQLNHNHLYNRMSVP